jgi:hypothetical protein
MTIKVMTTVGPRPEIIKLCRVIMNWIGTRIIYWSTAARTMIMSSMKYFSNSWKFVTYHYLLSFKTCYSSLVTRHYLLITCHYLLVTRNFFSSLPH